ncbi:MAG: DUF3313 family protein [Planctomycetia bacterium]|nr:DUF3313 family protein [Planctomycetia bacterium]
MHPTRSGFLTDYGELAPIDKRDRVRITPVDADALAGIDSFCIEPVEWLADAMGQPATSEKRQVAMQDAFQSALVEELGKIRPIVEEPGPQTAVVRAAVTGVRESRPWVNLFLSAQIAGPLFNGGAAAEIEVLAADGRQIAAESAGFTGHDWDVIGYFWGPNHPRSALRQAARRLARELEACESP